MQGKEDGPRQRDNNGKDLEGQKHAARNLPDLRHKDDQVHKVKRLPFIPPLLKFLKDDQPIAGRSPSFPFSLST